MGTENHQLIFIPGPGMGHIVAAVELAKLIINRDSNIAVTFLLISDPQVQSYTKSLHSNINPRLRFINLPEAQPNANQTSEHPSKPPPVLAIEHIESHKPQIRDAVLTLVASKYLIAGFIVDMFCLGMIDVANDFNIPAYLFFTSSAAFLSLKLYVQALHDERKVDITDYKDGDEEFLVPGFLNRVPAKVLPSVMMDKSWGFASVLNAARWIRETKGILVNTFQELEPHALEALSNSIFIPPVYPIGPVLNLDYETNDDDDGIIDWLDNQPASSVVFLCFGSLGSFSDEQIKEIGKALERSGHRFLWSLRRRASIDLVEGLPLGFLERTSGVGKVIGWAPQQAVLSHSAVGGFISHCGWNSILESLWFGVPIATWPMYAEQQVNAFEMVVELGMATEIKMDYREETGGEIVVTSEEIEKGIKQLMVEKDAGGVWQKLMEMKENSREALLEGGSSTKNLRCLIDAIMHSFPNQNVS